MWSRLPVAVLLLITLFAVGPLAYASPPDPTWIGGLYDADDYDDVVVAVSSTTAASPLGSTVVTPCQNIVWDIPHVTVAVVTLVRPSVASIRAPPTA